MYDSVTASAIPRDALIVGGYDDGYFVWSAADWALFPSAVHVHISSLGTDVGDVLDCEPGNPNAVASVNWALGRRAAGRDPYIYTAEWATGYTWAEVTAAFNARGVPLPHWWKAPGASTDLGDPEEPLMVQTQYPGPYDVGVAADFLPGIEGTAPPPPVALIEEDDELIQQFEYAGHPHCIGVGGDGKLYHSWQDAQGWHTENPAATQGQLFPQTVSVALKAPNDIDVFLMSAAPAYSFGHVWYDGKLWHNEGIPGA